MTMMKAVTLAKHGGPEVLSITDAPKPKLLENDVLVENKAAGTNPVDYKIREHGAGMAPEVTILGWDAAGVVVDIGSKVTNLKVGDEVYYAGSVVRNGTYAEFTAVDSRLVALKPKSLTWEESATIPLVAQTAYEALFVQMEVKKDKTILIYNGAGGVGSMAIQMAKNAGLKVIATASRPETIAWVKDLGADVVVNHRSPLKEQFEKEGIDGVDYMFHLFDNQHLSELCQLVHPFGKIAMIETLNSKDAMKDFDFMGVFAKCLSFHHVFMFTRGMFMFEPEKVTQMLKETADWIDNKSIKHTLTKVSCIKDVAEVHKGLQNSTNIGKVALKLEFN